MRPCLDEGEIKSELHLLVTDGLDLEEETEGEGAEMTELEGTLVSPWEGLLLGGQGLRMDLLSVLGGRWFDIKIFKVQQEFREGEGFKRLELTVNFWKGCLLFSPKCEIPLSQS